jgi:hypothetical protein
MVLKIKEEVGKFVKFSLNLTNALNKTNFIAALATGSV